MRQVEIELFVNGKPVRVEIFPSETLLDVLREKLGNTEVKKGCGKGDCGCCAVLIDGEPVNSCLVLAIQCAHKKIKTLKGISPDDTLHPLQKNFVKYGAIQCGFCTSGMIVVAEALLDRNPRPSREEIKEAIAGNLCRCTGYNSIIDAIEATAREL